MRIFDMHIHARDTEIDPKGLIEKFEEAGVYGGCVFSHHPDKTDPVTGMSFDERLETVLKWAEGYENRIFPILWIHPDDENVVDKIQMCVDRGIAGFKMICDNYYVYEERVLNILRAIAKTGKPVIFHSGILYMRGGVELAKYNRPSHWEALLSVPGLRFSMGHCSWPWTDECIALYGRMRFCREWYIPEGEKPPEIYLDLTPGTPDVYREDLLKKLYSYFGSIANNILFGTDCFAHEYSPKKTQDILKLDNKIMDKLGVSLAKRNKMYYSNLLRFLGREDLIEDEQLVLSSEECSDHRCEPCAEEICRKWYDKLGFCSDFDQEFNTALKTIKISNALDINTYDFSEKDGKRDLLSFLFMCEKLEKQYKEKGIDEEIFLDTVKDIVLWTNAWSEVKGELFLGETEWLARHMKMKIFRIGNLEFMPLKINFDCEEFGLKQGDNIMDVHIPAGADFAPDKIKESFKKAEKFFNKYYPEFEYTCYTCFSWLLDPELKNLLKETSNIISFQNLFTLIPEKQHESYSALKYIFKWNTNRISLRNEVCISGFAERLKKHVMAGGKLHESYGIFKK